jgi:hypothetical protein
MSHRLGILFIANLKPDKLSTEKWLEFHMSVVADNFTAAQIEDIVRNLFPSGKDSEKTTYNLLANEFRLWLPYDMRHSEDTLTKDRFLSIIRSTPDNYTIEEHDVA